MKKRRPWPYLPRLTFRVPDEEAPSKAVSIDHDPDSLIAKRDGVTGRWAFHSPIPKKGRPGAAPPIELAVEALELAILKGMGWNPKAEAQALATQKASEARTADAKTREADVLALTAEGHPPHVIAQRVGVTPRRVRQIQQAAKTGKPP